MTRVRRALTLLSLSAITLSAIPANAVVPPSVFKDSVGNVYVHNGVAAGSRLKVELIGQPLKRRVRAGYCGQLTLRPSSASPSLGSSVTINSGTAISLTTIAVTAQPPRCSSNAFTPATNSHFKTSDGQVVLVGYTPGVLYDVAFEDVPNTFNVTVNGCNFAQIRPTETRPLTAQIAVNDMAYTVSNLVIADPPICRRNSLTNISTRYVPANW